MSQEHWSFAFVDLAGFTALTEAHGDDLAAEHVDRFCTLGRQTLAGRTQLVKSMGDAVMLAGADPGDVLRSAHALMSAALAEPDFPVPRAGAHSGTATRTGPDFVGMAVNIAARLAARAAGGELLVGGSLAAAAVAQGHAPVSLGPVRLRNVREPMEVFLLEMLPGGGVLIDPVCRMRVTPATSAGHLLHAGRTWWFCSLTCAAAFAEDAPAYTAGQQPG